MEEVLKGLKGKSFNKRKLFDFLADIDLDLLSGKKVLQASDVDKKFENTEPEEIKCNACSKIFTVKASLKRHLNNNKMCVDWISNKQEHVNLDKGLHLVLDSLLSRAVSEDDKLECRWCNSSFTNKGNLHKHFNGATLCNQFAYQEFKRIFLNL